MSITHPAPPSPFTVRSRAVTTGPLQRLGLLIIASHAVLLAIAHWLLLQQFLGWTAGDVARLVTVAFRQYSLRVFGAELAALAAAAAAVFAVRRALADAGSGRDVAAAGLLAYAPLALYSAGTLVALAMGWELDVRVMSATDASNADILASIQEALPIVLQPLLLGRYVATVVATLTFAVLQRTLCRVPGWQAAIVAAAAGTAAIGMQLLILGTPFE